ncbi:ABC transporter substrate-binding protein [Lacrimispora sp.]|uniref:ABC transporter substrate-binding protein n=1 Tax=Lacrimispora sp. TaxID=2719234 RepID=UPI00345F32DA
MKKRSFAILAAAMAAAALTACGGKSSQTGSSQAGSTAASEAGSTASAETSSTGANDGQDLKKITFVLDWTPNTNHTGLYVAQEKGYFKEAGLEVEIVQPPEDGAEVLVASGKAQFGISFQDSMAPALTGDTALPITAVAAVIQHNTSGIISRKGEGMDSPKGLEGKKYATWDLPVEKAMVEDVMTAAGGDFSKVQLIPSTVTDEVSALQSKSVDAIWIFYAWAGVKMEVENLPTDYFAFADINPVFDYYTPVVIAGNEFLKQDPETARAFLSALSQGYEDAVNDPEEAGRILLKAAPELDEELVMASQKYLADQYKADVDVWGYMDPERWNRFYVWLNEKGLSEEIPENTGFTNDYLPQ